MPECNNCDAFVTEAYVRVFAPSERDTVRVCPSCEDLIREGSGTRASR
jgi:NAD-dependent SIR2 family protein deacetylase